MEKRSKQKREDADDAIQPDMKSALVILLLLFAGQTEVCSAFQNHGFVPARMRQRRAFGRSAAPLQAAGFLDELASAYSYGMENFYLVTQSVTGGVLCGIGDAMAQVKGRFLDEKPPPKEEHPAVDWDRVTRFALKGLGGGIVWSQWYPLADAWSLQLSDHFLTTLDADAAFGDTVHRVTRTVSSILLEQFVACPIVYSLWDIPFPMVASGAPVASVPGQVRSKLPGLLLENAKVWSFVNILIYNIPLEFRLLTMCTADVFWQSVVATVAAEAAADADGVKTEDEVGDRLGVSQLLNATVT